VKCDYVFGKGKHGIAMGTERMTLARQVTGKSNRYSERPF